MYEAARHAARIRRPDMTTLEQRYMAAAEFRAYVDLTSANRELWTWGARRAEVPDDLLARATALGGRWHLLVLSEDWCGDAVNTVPVVARLAERAPNIDLRLLGRDANLDIMDAHLSNGARAIPIVILLDEHFVERGWWGSRPAPLQHWMKEEGLQLPKEDRYRRVREWYARDRGRTTAEEIVALMEAAAAPVEAAA
jgi:hypothetical protein